jgi:nucleotide-binding universal stress UspA family protein
MYRHILVPLDGSTRAEVALNWAETLIETGQSTKLTLLRITPEALHATSRPNGASPAQHSGPIAVNPPPNVFAGSSAAIVDSHIQNEVETASRYLESLAARLHERGIRVHAMTLAAASPAEGIMQTAAQTGSDLIVMASHGRGGLARLLAGSVTDAVARNARVPVLVCHGAEAHGLAPGAFKRVLVPLDGSNLSESAIKHARRIAAPNARLLLQRVVQAPELPASALGEQSRMVLERGNHQPDAERRLDYEIELARQYLQTTAAQIQASTADNGVMLETVAYPGSPGAAIVDLARTDAVDVIVMASHGLAGLRRALLGSVTDHVVRNAPCPVLVAHDPV